MSNKLIVLVLLLFAAAGHSQPPSKAWVADNGDGTFKNPVINADYSDPDVVRVGADYYMTASSFNSVPGLPILHSKDLVNWRIINHAIRELEPADILPDRSTAAASGLRRSGTITANITFITAIRTSAYL